MGGDFFCSGIDVAQIRVTITPSGGRTDGDKNQIGLADIRPQFGRKFQTTGIGIAFDQIIQTGFVNRDPPGIELVNFILSNIHADHICAEFCEACAGHQADIAGANHYHIHFYIP